MVDCYKNGRVQRVPLATISETECATKPNALDLAIEMCEKIVLAASLLRDEELLIFKQLRQQRFALLV